MTPPPSNPSHPANDDKAVVTRRVDLGREDQLVTWAEWFQRSAAALDAFIELQHQQHQRLLAQHAGSSSDQFDGANDDHDHDSTNTNSNTNTDDPQPNDPQTADPPRGPSGGGAKVFRVTLTDGRPFAVTAVHTHMNRGRCFVGKDRWGEENKVCDVITGYTMIGAGPDNRPTALSVPPTQIASVECVLIPPRQHANALEKPKENDTQAEAFGFARFAQMRDRPQLQEVDDDDG